MKLEDQVCSLELAKKIKEIGLKLDSYFAYYWVQHKNQWEIMPQTENKIGLPAFTVTELIDTLPFCLTKKEVILDIEDNNVEFENHFFLLLMKKNIGYSAQYWSWDYSLRSFNNNGAALKVFDDMNQANTCAKMLIYLIENKISNSN